MDAYDYPAMMKAMGETQNVFAITDAAPDLMRITRSSSIIRAILGQQHGALDVRDVDVPLHGNPFFGGVLCAYWVYRIMYPKALAAEQHRTNSSSSSSSAR